MVNRISSWCQQTDGKAQTFAAGQVHTKEKSKNEIEDNIIKKEDTTEEKTHTIKQHYAVLHNTDTLKHKIILI